MSTALLVHADPGVSWHPSQVLTNVSQFRALPLQDYLRSFSFRLGGTVTFVDTNRSLVVIQDDTGSMAVNVELKDLSLKPGQVISIEGTNAAPYLSTFPEYPFRASGWDIRSSFEAPSNWGDYHLTRMRGFLHPPITGEYTFWIASDNSSELWLSNDADPGNVRRIAFVRQWVSPHEWFREAGQRSETIFLRAGEEYYIEAFQEQLTLDDHLSVSWAGPGFGQPIIDARYLSPWIARPEQAPFAGTNGILREYWTNYFAGALVGVCGPKPLESILTVDNARVVVTGNAPLPEPVPITLADEYPADQNFRRVQVDGMVSFTGNGGDSAILQLSDGLGQAQVRLSGWGGNLADERTRLARAGAWCL